MFLVQLLVQHVELILIVLRVQLHAHLSHQIQQQTARTQVLYAQQVFPSHPQIVRNVAQVTMHLLDQLLVLLADLVLIVVMLVQYLAKLPLQTLL